MVQAHVEIRDSRLLPCVSWRADLGCQAQQRIPMHSEPLTSPCIKILWTYVFLYLRQILGKQNFNFELIVTLIFPFSIPSILYKIPSSLPSLTTLDFHLSDDFLCGVVKSYPTQLHLCFRSDSCAPLFVTCISSLVNTLRSLPFFEFGSFFFLLFLAYKNSLCKLFFVIFAHIFPAILNLTSLFTIIIASCKRSGRYANNNYGVRMIGVFMQYLSFYSKQTLG